MTSLFTQCETECVTITLEETLDGAKSPRYNPVPHPERQGSSSLVGGDVGKRRAEWSSVSGGGLLYYIDEP